MEVIRAVLCHAGVSGIKSETSLHPRDDMQANATSKYIHTTVLIRYVYLKSHWKPAHVRFFVILAAKASSYGWWCVTAVKSPMSQISNSKAVLISLFQKRPHT